MKFISLVGLAPDLVDSVCCTLKAVDLSLSVFSNMAAAMPSFSRRPPDIAVIRLMLPDGDAYQLVEAATKSGQGACDFIILTSMGADGEPIRDWSGPVGTYLWPPVEPWQIVLSIEQALFRSLSPRGSGHETTAPE